MSTQKMTTRESLAWAALTSVIMLVALTLAWRDSLWWLLLVGVAASLASYAAVMRVSRARH
jgi:hypothetical protein